MVNTDFTIALAGNPNSGKSSVFNSLTGAQQHVGNWPGKTVERMRGQYEYAGSSFEVIDLPGTYSLAAYSEEEGIARDYLLDEAPNLVVLVLDATNLERHLYLAVQILEMNIPAVLALNMSDLADRKGYRIDTERLSERVGGVPVVRVVASKGEGIEALRIAIAARLNRVVQEHPTRSHPPAVRYAPELERALEGLAPALQQSHDLPGHFPVRWLALELLANGHSLMERLNGRGAASELVQAVEYSKAQARAALPEGVDLHIAEARFNFVSRIVAEVLETERDEKGSWSERIDQIVTHHIVGIPIFLAIMYLVFRLVVDVSAPYLDWIDSLVSGPLTSWTRGLLEMIRAPGWLQGLFVEGVIAGVGGVLVFLPGLIVLFIFIAVLEESGYLARAAFVMNRFLAFLGLNGKSFVPLILGFGCAVPAIYATRTLDRKRDRLLTALMVPLMSCSARLPVYVLFGMALFGDRADQVIWGLYAFGVAAAILVGWIFSRTIFRTEGASEFLMELPPYRLPSLRSLWSHVSIRTRDFIEGAGTVILVASMVIWVLLNIPAGSESLEDSAFGQISGSIAPVFEPAGFGTWDATASLMSGLIAKEVVVSTMSEIYLGSPLETQSEASVPLHVELKEIGTGFISATVEAGRKTLEALTPGIHIFPRAVDEAPRQTALSSALNRSFTPLAGLAFLVYVLLYVPCIATLGVIRSEFGGRWALFSALYQSGIAWLVAVGVYQVGLLIG